MDDQTPCLMGSRVWSFRLSGCDANPDVEIPYRQLARACNRRPSRSKPKERSPLATIEGGHRVQDKRRFGRLSRSCPFDLHHLQIVEDTADKE